MEHAIVSLEAPGTDWASLVRFVERSGQPLWLEADGEIQGVLLPTAQARELMGQCVLRHSTQHGGHAPDHRDPLRIISDLHSLIQPRIVAPEDTTHL